MRSRVLCLLAAVLALLLAAAPSASAQAPPGSSLERAYEFLDQAMDRYAAGATMRLVQSFTGGVLERDGYTDSVTYDDALIIDALLARGSAEDLERAQVIGSSLLYVQAHDPAGDGRVRAAYAPKPLLAPSDVVATDATSDVGNMAWVGQALVQLYDRTGDAQYLDGALRLGEWVQANAYDARGAGGYTGGYEPNGSKIEWKSTEHNIDLYALFELLAEASGESAWTTRAASARRFVESMWDAKRGMFWVGTGENGVSVNRSVLAEDVNSWSYLAFEDPAFASSIDWDAKYLSVTRGGFSGVSFCRGARNGVWFEGTAHLADALLVRGHPGDRERAGAYLDDILHAQEDGLDGDGLGIIAASRNGVGNCEGEPYYASLHTGATAWYLLALQAADPFRRLL